LPGNPAGLGIAGRPIPARINSADYTRAKCIVRLTVGAAPAARRVTRRRIRVGDPGRNSRAKIPGEFLKSGPLKR